MTVSDGLIAELKSEVARLDRAVKVDEAAVAKLKKELPGKRRAAKTVRKMLAELNGNAPEAPAAPAIGSPQPKEVRQRLDWPEILKHVQSILFLEQPRRRGGHHEAAEPTEGGPKSSVPEDGRRSAVQATAQPAMGAGRVRRTK